MKSTTCKELVILEQPEASEASHQRRNDEVGRRNWSEADASFLSFSSHVVHGKRELVSEFGRVGGWGYGRLCGRCR
jgi:hypothetical protein